MPSVLLVGIISVMVGYFQESRIALDAGLLITMTGVVIGIRQLLAGNSRH